MKEQKAMGQLSAVVNLLSAGLSNEQVEEVLLLIAKGQVEPMFHPVRYECKTYQAEGALMRLGVGPRIPVMTNQMLMRTRPGGID